MARLPLPKRVPIPQKAQQLSGRMASSERDTSAWIRQNEEAKRIQAQQELKQRLRDSQLARASAGQKTSNFSTYVQREEIIRSAPQQDFPKYAKDERELRKYIEQQTAQLRDATNSGTSAIEAENKELKTELEELRRGQERIGKQEEQTQDKVKSALLAAGKSGMGIGGAAVGVTAGVAGYAWGKGDALLRASADSVKKASGGTVWIFLFFIIALLDVAGSYIYSGFKSPYSGFFFPVEQLKLEYFFGVITSTFFLGLLLSKVIFGAFEKKFSIGHYVVYVSLVYWLNSWATFSFGNYGYIATAVGILVFIILMNRGQNSQTRIFSIEDISFFLYAVVLTVLLHNSLSWFRQGDWLPFIHLAVILFFFYGFYKSLEPDEGTFYFQLFFVLLLDFFGTNYLQQFPLVQNIPLLFLVTTWIISKKTQSWTAAFIMFVLIILSIGFTSEGYKTAFGEQVKLTKDTTTKSLSDRVSAIGNIFNNFIKTRTEFATQFGGSVEQNQYESLGVYFSNLKAAQPRFYTDEKVIIWGGIRSKTYQDAIAITASCYKKKDEKNKQSGVMNPQKPFLIFQSDETDVECTFPPNTFDAGSHAITLAADYNFITNAHQKVYFMDKDRYRNYIREGLDPLTEFGITDKNPATVFTNGPVEIGMKVDPLIAIDRFINVDSYRQDSNSLVLPAIYLTFTNRKEITDQDKKLVTRWEGKIKNIRELILLVPPGVTIPNPADCQPIGFRIYSPKECEASCSDPKLCSSGCPEGARKETCLKDCEEVKKKCVEDCSYMFRGQDNIQKYTAYALDISKIPSTYETYAKDIDKFKTFSCRFLPANDALDMRAPITTSYFRVRAKYDYLAENQVPIVIEQSPTGAKPTTKAPVTAILRESAGTFDEIVEGKNVFINTAGTAAYAREELYSPIALKVAKEQNVDYFLMKAMIQQESTWDPTRDNGISVGIMQLRPETASRINCLQAGNSIDIREQLKDAETSMRCGAMYIKTLISYRDTNGLKPGIQNIIGGYNGGEGAMKYSTDAGKTHLTVWENENNAGYAETRNHVSTVVQNYNTLLKNAGIVQQTASSPQSLAQTTILQFSAAINNGIQASMSWKLDPATEIQRGIASYSVFRYEGTSSPIPISNCQRSIGASSYACSDPESLVPGKSYTYRLMAYNGEFEPTMVLQEEKSLTASQPTVS